MSVTNVHKDPERLTMTMTCEFEASQERVWQLWADPRQLERWWGPPTWPATFTVHDLRPGGRAEYRMTGEGGGTSAGYFEFLEVRPPSGLLLLDGFIGPDGAINTSMPTVSIEVTIEQIGEGRSRMVIANKFPNLEAMQTLLEMGMDEGMSEALGQIDAILAEDTKEDA